MKRRTFMRGAGSAAMGSMLGPATLLGLPISPGDKIAAVMSGMDAQANRVPTGTGNLPFAGTDPNTTALWLFDDPPNANVILTDAGPYQIDLRLETGRERPLPKTMLEGTRGLVPGKFGRALHLPMGEGAGVSWAKNSWRRDATTFMSNRGDEVPERCNLGYLDFTLEFWFQASGSQASPGVVWELRNEGPDPVTGVVKCPQGFNALLLDSGRQRFQLVSKVLVNRHFSFELPIASDPAKLNDGQWHHLAFTFTAGERQMRHYVDGRVQPLPEHGTFLPLFGQLISMRIGRDMEGQQELEGLLDEMRISDVVRYKLDFTPPGSFSRNYGTNPPTKGVANGPPLLFTGMPSGEPVNLGLRKHLFLDDVLIETQANVSLTVNPPTRRDVTDFHIDRPWEPTPRMGPGIPDIGSIWDDGDQLRMLYDNNGMWGGKPSAVCLAESKDGLHWTKPELNLVPWDGSLANNIVLRIASQGTVIRDPNPATPAEERFKYVAWCMDRGFYVFTSPDAIHWRRNETLALPFDPDGSIAFFWDDQCGLYRGYLRALLGAENYRAIVRAETQEILKPWPFKLVQNPTWLWWMAPKPVSGELPTIDTGGEVYRFYASKYPWATDAYVSFPWRYVREINRRPGSFLMTSRDGVDWRRYETPYYFGAGEEMDGRTVQEALMEQGMIRRGDEIWQYGTIRFTEHAGALYGGVEHEGGYFDRLLRLVQRLDGFVSLDAGETRGSVTTRPIVFEGKRLTLNVAASKGTVRVALLNEAGGALSGFRLEDCEPVRSDSVRQTVRWKGGSEVGNLAGKPARLQFELTSAKLYAFQFN